MGDEGEKSEGEKKVPSAAKTKGEKIAEGEPQLSALNPQP